MGLLYVPLYPSPHDFCPSPQSLHKLNSRFLHVYLADFKLKWQQVSLTYCSPQLHPCLSGEIQGHCWISKPALKQIWTNYSSDHLSPGNYSHRWLFLWYSEIHRPCLKQSLWGSQLGGLSTSKWNKCFSWICYLQHPIPALLPFHCSYISVTTKASQDLRHVRLWEEHGVGKEYLPVTTYDKEGKTPLFYSCESLDFLLFVLFQLHLIF